MGRLTENNLITISTPLKTGQRCLRIGNRIVPVGVGGMDEPSGGSSGSSMDFYKCNSVSVPVEVSFYRVSGAGSDVNGDYYPTGATSRNKPVYSFTNQNSVTYYLYCAGQVWWALNNLPPGSINTWQQAAYYLLTDPPTSSGWQAGTGTSPAPSITQEIGFIGSETWTGYKAVLNNGVYSFESAVTSGLTYGAGFTPLIGNVYSDGGLIQATLWGDIPANGLVFYASLNGVTPDTAETRQSLSIAGTVSYNMVDGVPCAYFNGSSNLSFDASALPASPNPISISLWAKANITDMQRCAFSYGTDSANKAIAVMLYTNGKVKTIGTNDAANEWTSDTGAVSTTAWNHIAVVNHGTCQDIFVNGVKIGTFTYTREVTNSYGYIGSLMADTTLYTMIGYVSSVRVYNRALSPTEIAALAAEFTPSAS